MESLNTGKSKYKATRRYSRSQEEPSRGHGRGHLSRQGPQTS